MPITSIQETSLNQTQTESMRFALGALEGLINRTSAQAIYSFMETERRIAISACVGLREALAEQPRLLSAAPCDQCGYNGPGYYQPKTHPCASKHHKALAEQPAQPEPSHSDMQLAEQIMSDCGCSTNNQRLLERITERLAKHRPAQPQQEPTCKQHLQVWVIPNGEESGQFSWEPQDERFWTRMQPAQTATYTCGVCGVSMQMEQPAQQEPVAWHWLYNGQPDSEKHFSMPGPDAEVISRASACEFPRTVQYLYTSPPASKPWVGLTKEEKEHIRNAWGLRTYRAIEDTEAKLREKNA